MTRHNLRNGILLMVAATLVLAIMDGVSRHLAGRYNVFMVVAVRYWFFAAFVVILSARRAGGLSRVAATPQPGWQILRGVLLAGEVCVTVAAFVWLGLIETHAIFASFPLMIATLSGPVLGEKVDWRRGLAIAVGFVGILIILQPGVRVVSPAALIPLAAAFVYACYGLLTRFVARRDDAATSFFWTGVAGAVVMTPLGIWFWQPLSPGDWGWMAVLSVISVLGHWLLIKSYEQAEASKVQPFSYLQLVFVTVIGVSVFGESVGWPLIIGAAIVVAAGVFSLGRAGVVASD